ncbi:MAG TPA: hypothetical protein VJ044_00520, partial [Candidatus Hodarchaeales archaeon]|nr:hypothetical protein [Candidatus Hodarchaeales archaeon]
REFKSLPPHQNFPELLLLSHKSEAYTVSHTEARLQIEKNLAGLLVPTTSFRTEICQDFSL